MKKKKREREKRFKDFSNFISYVISIIIGEYLLFSYDRKYGFLLEFD